MMLLLEGINSRADSFKCHALRQEDGAQACYAEMAWQIDHQACSVCSKRSLTMVEAALDSGVVRLFSA